MKTLRIFISSPGDVRPERVRALDVTHKLQARYRAFINLQPILWEHEAMNANSSFQDQIIPPSKTDIVICILWSRIGTRLPAGYKRDDGTVPSGTEWEFEDAYAGRKERGIPDIYVYRKTAEARIELGGADYERQFEEWRDQKKALDVFLNHWFTSHDGSFKAGFNTFETDEQFEELLDLHLDQLIAAKVRSEQADFEERQKITWFEGSPFLGLRAFQPKHEAIFFGRDLDTRKIVDRLKGQAAGSSRVFLMILGMSGCGKSSLVRAGVLPALERPGETEFACWRRLLLRPSEAGDSLLAHLGEGFLDALPELANTGYDSNGLKNLLREGPVHAIPPIQMALHQAGREHGRLKGLNSTSRARLFLLIDQFEEIFTLDRFREERETFMAALATLSRCGLVWVVVTMRSDLYGRCAEIGSLMELKGDDGHYDLAPPGFAELSRMIRLPAHAAGLRYGTDPETGRSLDDALLEEAWKNPKSLPLLEFTLDELFKNKSEANVLTWKAYVHLGGMKGAISKRAETEYGDLSPAAKNALHAVFGRLVTFENNHATAQQASASEVAALPGADELVKRFVDANLFVAAGGAGHEADPKGVTISMAHEALLESWPLLREWIESHRENLKSHAAVTADTKRWLENECGLDYLYHSGQPLERARLALDADFLNGEEREFVRASLRNVAKHQFQDSLESADRMFDFSEQLRAAHPDIRHEVLSSALSPGTDDRAISMRIHAATVLGMSPVEELTRELVRLVISDPDDSVRRTAAASLMQINQPEYFQELVAALGSRNRNEAIRALACIRVAADALENQTSFEPIFERLERRQRSRIISQARVLRLKRGWPTLFVVVTPAVILSSVFASVFKAFPGHFNFALCQIYPSAFAGFFHAIVACFFWGGMIAFAITFHRVVLNCEWKRKSFLHPWTALVAGAIGGVISSLGLLAVMTLVGDPEAIRDLGWTDKMIRAGAGAGAYWIDILFRSRAFWPYLIMGTGLGIGMAAMANGLQSSREWASLAGKQSLLTGKEVLSLLKRLINLMPPFVWPVIFCLLVADVLAFYIVRTAPFARDPSVIARLPKPMLILSWRDALLGGMSPNLASITPWKVSAWGQALGITFDSMTQAVGAFFCIVGMGLGLIVIRCGFRINPRKN